MSLVIDGKRYDIAGIQSACFLDNPKFGFTDKTDFSVRKGAPRSICLHTRMGVHPQKIVDSIPNRRWDELGVKRASSDDRNASWHISIDADGSFVCHLDCYRISAHQASQLNEYSVGIEMYQTLEGEITKATLATAVKICNKLTEVLGIQRQFPIEDKISVRFASNSGSWHKTKKLAYMAGGESGATWYGVFGHRNLTRNRGKGDPGDEIFKLLKSEGYEGFHVDTREDIEVWKQRQAKLKFGTSDGIPGPATVAELKRAGYPHGLYITVP